MPKGRKPGLAGRHLARAVWRLLRVYWSSPDAKWGALLLFGAIALELGTVRTQLFLAEAQGQTFDSLETRVAAQFFEAVSFLVVSMGLFVIASTYRTYLRQALEIRWRRLLTDHYLERWMNVQAYCQAELHRGEVDNPDQRVAEDVREFVASALGLSLSFLSAVATLVTFGGLLWGLSRDWPLQIGGTALRIPGFMLWIAVGFSLLSTWITHLVGRRLVPINFDKLRFEADFRYGLMRFRDNVETAVFSRGERCERLGAEGRFRQVVGNFWQLIRAQRNLNLFTTGIGQLNEIVPLLLAAPFYFARLITLGKIAQTRIAYVQVASALTWFVNAYQEIARWRASVERLATFSAMMDATQRELAAAGIRLEPSPDESLRLSDLAVEVPRGHLLLEGVNASIEAGQRVAITGPSGSGKTVLMRSIAGLWPFGSGSIQVPARTSKLFLPQWPYLPLGSLRAAVSFPSPEGSFPDERIREAMRVLGLSQLEPRLDEQGQWEQQLSPHEQQRLALARVLLHEPEWVFLDKATSALDEAMERRVYELLAERLPHATVVSVTHRPAVAGYHERLWTLGFKDNGRVELRAA
jgi:putative ATP-binding cassette transporter